MALNSNADFNQLSTWLNQNLTEKNSIIPHTNTIPKIYSKGIYFWFMHPEGYKALSKFVIIEPITTRYTKEIDSVKYDLVYLGTTGTGKAGNSNLTIRLNWHINQEHRESTICQKESALSTLRTGLGGLLSEDLITPNTESLINTFMITYLKVFWIEYPNNKQLIDSAEETLIKIIRPLLNIKNNPNAKINALNNPTKTYKLRRGLVESNTKYRLGFENKELKNKNTAVTLKPKTSNETENSSISKNDCVEFRVLQNQSIAVLAGDKRNLPVGVCTIEIINPVNGQYLYIQKNGNPIRTIRTRLRTVSEYFNAQDTTVGLYKWQVVQNEMINDGIKEIIVRVCPID
jgi:hypothetical protein